MSEQLKTQDGAATVTIKKQSIILPENFELCLLERSDTDHRSVYAILHNGDHIGSFQLHDLAENEIGFHIGLEESQRHRGYGTRIYAYLGEYLAEKNIVFHTRCIDPEAAPYWQHLAEKGLVVIQENEEGSIAYQYPRAGIQAEYLPQVHSQQSEIDLPREEDELALVLL